MSPGQNGDPIDAAIAAVEQQVTMRQWQVTITSTGRPGIVVLPTDVSDAELAEFAGWLLTYVLGSYRAERVKGPASRIIRV